MSDLRTNYNDDVLDTTQNTKRKYTVIDNADGTKSFTDETEYSQAGDTFGAADLNATNAAINALNSELTSGTEQFYYDIQGGRRGYNTSSERGADTFHPFRGTFTIPYISLAAGGYVSGQTESNIQINVADYDTLQIDSIGCNRGTCTVLGDSTSLGTFTAGTNININISAYSTIKLAWTYFSTEQVQTVSCNINGIKLS